MNSRSDSYISITLSKPSGPLSNGSEDVVETCLSDESCSFRYLEADPDLSLSLPLNIETMFLRTATIDPKEVS